MKIRLFFKLKNFENLIISEISANFPKIDIFGILKFENFRNFPNWKINQYIKNCQNFFNLEHYRNSKNWQILELFVHSVTSQNGPNFPKIDTFGIFKIGKLTNLQNCQNFFNLQNSKFQKLANFEAVRKFGHFPN